MLYYAYRLMDRKNSYIQRYGRLFHQYIVDQYAKVEQGRLNYQRFNLQNNYRTELLSGLKDSLSRNDSDARQIGKRVFLGSSFLGSPRNMMQRYMDAMAIVTAYGKPDLFLTFTCNPNWPEIKNELKSGESPNDQPALLARVFRLKLKELLNDVVKKHVLGRVVSYVQVIEFQKRYNLF